MLNRQSGANRISVANDVPAVNPGMTGDRVRFWIPVRYCFATSHFNGSE